MVFLFDDRKIANAILVYTMRPLIHSFDQTITSYTTSLPAWLHSFFIVITSIGTPLITLSIGAAIALYGLYKSNSRLAVSGAVVWITFGAGSIIKLLVGRERPLTEYAAHLTLDTLSFPSGHTSGSTIAYGLIAYILWQLLPKPLNYISTALLIVLIILIGVSRIYLGAHFPSDVVAGCLLGIIMLGIVIFYIKPSVKR